MIRSQTLDSSELASKLPENVRIGQEDATRTAINAMKNRSFSMSSNEGGVTEEERRRSVSSIGSYEERRSVSGSMENLDKKSEDYPSRPESRTSSRMNRIMEDDVKIVDTKKSPSPQVIDISQKNVDFKLPVEEIKTKSSSPVNKVINKVEEKEDTISCKAKDDKLIKNIQNGVCEKTDVLKHETKNLELKNLKKAKSHSRSG